jgi:hypothetical protein
MSPRLWFATFLVLGLPAGPLPSQGPDPEPPPKVGGVEGTVWSGIDSGGERWTFRFLKGGILDYTVPSGTYRNGTWKQTGASIYLETNRKYAEFRGAIKGNEIVGKASNRAGKNWTWKVKKQ